MIDVLHDPLIDEIASRLDLREPNKRALQAIAYDFDHYFNVEGNQPPREVVVDAATGMGKTYILAAAIEYFACQGIRNFAVITPGRTILNKTVANFTLGHPKSLLGGMEVEPQLITADTFATPQIRAVLDDEVKVKIFVFTAQSLLRPNTETARRTRKFQEGLGKALYEHLQGLPDLIVFADEHHVYHAAQFSDAVRGLKPHALIGLTATPNKRALERAGIPIIFRYPLAAAIADQYVKTPVIVGRKDDTADPKIKIADGLRLLEAKEQAIQAYCERTGARPVAPVMLIVCENIDQAEEYGKLLDDPHDPVLGHGKWGGDKVLVVHSNLSGDKHEEMLAALDQVENPDSPVRVIISVGMLKEGWDVKNVYVICSMRPSISEILTEQTLGRGLRLAFGHYTGVELLDTLEVIAHESYDKLLRQAKVINEQFIDAQTRIAEQQTRAGETVPRLDEEQVSVNIINTHAAGGERAGAVAQTDPGAIAEPPPGAVTIGTVEDRQRQAALQADAVQQDLTIRPDAPTLKLPVLRLAGVTTQWSLNDITDLDQFRKLGERISANPASELRRVKLDARIITGPDGLPRTELVTVTPEENIEAQPALIPLEDAKRRLVEDLLNAPVVPARAGEKQAAGRIVNAFVDGLGDRAEEVLGSYMERASGGLIEAVTEAQRQAAATPTYEQVVDTYQFDATRTPRAATSTDRVGAFKRNVGYEGYRKSFYTQDWFDSSAERAVANLLDADDAIAWWLRLQRGDLVIEWSRGAYHPDFIAIDTDGIHWVIEVKADRDMTDDAVQAKRDAAKQWANHVNASDAVKAQWRYLLVSESDVQQAKGSWQSLRALA